MPRLGNTAISFKDAGATTDHATARYPYGQIRVEETSATRGCETFRYTTFDNGAGNIAAAAGAIAYRGDTQANFWDVTSDVSDVDAAFAAGVFQNAITDARKGWIKTQGYEASLKKKTGTGFAWVKGDYLSAAPSATDDGKARNIKIAATTKVSGAEIRLILERNVGFAAAAASSTTATGAAYIDLE